MTWLSHPGIKKGQLRLLEQPSIGNKCLHEPSWHGVALWPKLGGAEIKIQQRDFGVGTQASSWRGNLGPLPTLLRSSLTPSGWRHVAPESGFQPSGVQVRLHLQLCGTPAYSKGWVFRACRPAYMRAAAQ